MSNKDEITIKNYLLLKGINAKQKKMKRKIENLNGESFFISIDEPLKNSINNVDMDVKEIFSITYKVLDILKYQENFNISYIPKDLVFKGICSSEESKYNISIYDSYSLNNNYDDLNLKQSSIILVDNMDSVELVRI